MNGWQTEDKHILHEAEGGAEHWAEEEGGEERKEALNPIWRRKTRIEVAIPSSILATEHTLLLKTLLIARLLRFLVIFRVEKIHVYNDGEVTARRHAAYTGLIKDIYRYMTTPPYLRKTLVPLKKSLRYIGIAQPLRLNIYEVRARPRPGEIRLGYIYRARNGFYAQLGDKREYRVKNYGGEPGVHALLVESTSPPIARYDKEIDNKVYRGPEITVHARLDDVIVMHDECLKIATSRMGRRIDRDYLCDVLAETLRRYKCIALYFGGPRTGLYEVARREGWGLEKKVDLVLNTVPGQGVRTIRTEEAVIATLSLINPFIP